MHILGILYICLMLGALFSLGDVVGAWIQDRRARRALRDQIRARREGANR